MPLELFLSVECKFCLAKGILMKERGKRKGDDLEDKEDKGELTGPLEGIRGRRGTKGISYYTILPTLHPLP
ncbi:hypothetical protein, partial [Fischerella thermalis]|uniref:hypothetical protein n=1 Tax=Fischerella thermalis TaxID=372787 RepID=UPI001CA58F80